MKAFLKQNFAIVLAFALPIAFILGTALMVYLPSLLLSPRYNFVYATCGLDAEYYADHCDNYLAQRFAVVDGELKVHPVDPARDSDEDGVPDVEEYDYTAHVFLHNTKTNQSREITLQKATSLALSGLLTSPDGVTFAYRNGGDVDFFLFFDGGGSYGYYLVEGDNRLALNLISGHAGYYFDDSIRFLGWVLPGREQ